MITDDPQIILKNLLDSQDLNILEYKDWLLIDEQLPAMRASTQNYKEQEGRGSIRLDISILLDKDKMIWESFAGIGKDKLSATQNAFQNFASNSFYVILSAFWKIADIEQVGVEEWEIDGNMWEAHIGNFGCKGDFDIPEHLFPLIEEQITNETLVEDRYWFRFYYANIDAKEILVEALKNNEKWIELETKSNEIDWPKSDKFYSLRNFIILQRKK